MDVWSGQQGQSWSCIPIYAEASCYKYEQLLSTMYSVIFLRKAWLTLTKMGRHQIICLQCEGNWRCHLKVLCTDYMKKTDRQSVGYH